MFSIKQVGRQGIKIIKTIVILGFILVLHGI